MIIMMVDGCLGTRRSMAQGEHPQKYSNSSSGGGPSGSGGGGATVGGGGGSGCDNNGSGGGVGTNGRSQKKMKQKKIPQRGLGVAQLEKIRLEEQQKKGGVVLPSTNVLSPNQILSPSNSSSCLAVHCPTFRPSVSSSSPVPLQPPSPSDLPSPNSLFKPTPSIPTVDILHPNSVRLPKPLSVGGVGGGGEIGWPAVPVPGHVAWPKVWNGEFSVDHRENHRMDHQGFVYRPNVNLPFESSPPAPFSPVPNVLQRSQQFQPQSSSSMVSISTGISPSPVLNFQMEPPSNQNFCGSNYTPLWPDEEKMVGMKRPYPFPVETPPAPAFHFKVSPCYVAPVSRLDEPASASNRCSVNTADPGFSVIREGSSRSSTQSETTQTEVKTGENGKLNVDFLTLAPPAAASPNLSSKHKYSWANSGPRSRELSEFGSQQCQFNTEENIPGEGQPSKPMRPPFFSFFPAAKKQIGQSATSANNCNGEIAEKVDLSLKL